MSLTLQPYDRAGAVAYAHHWAYGRNPRFYDYERLGGDSFDGQRFAHSPVVVGGTERPDRTLQLLVAAHSHDCDNRPLHTYPFQKARYLHITGIYRP